MAIVINGSGTVTGLAVGGLPDGTVDTDTLANTTVTAAKVAADVATQAEIDAKLNLAGGTMTGNIVMADDTSIGISDSAERIEFDGAGDINILGAKLGIGTTSPEGLLSLEHSNTTAPSGSDSPTASAIQIHNTGGANAISAITFTGADHSGDGAIASIYAKHTNVSENSESSALHFLTSHNEANVNALEITSDGRGLSEFTAKAWVKCTGSSSINSSHNVSSVTDVSAGTFQINVTNNFTNIHWTAVASAGGTGSGSSYTYHAQVHGQSAASWGIRTSAFNVSSPYYGDPGNVFSVAYGE